ncbi:glycosyltransferase [Vibrio parahaemolyticus]|uniref:glycosyltransferase n=1 Tax=Vibrio parahaemolyticus TaxID=670 RepID=UPI00193DEA59|nr:glycosyltransferase family 4 protein [Vibrio parahaemolyticus]EIY8172755.1 glycosyltransferase family 4 protein [Vibrio parahaemolyticus]EIY8250545.1 glycosyltransferase family 4 protein [Vibrio parahaemolyticus]ELA8140969.1 glycosyltransferase family 4 protein [Vibrio parahaemolyticus]MBM4894446.1 glycosyltransferase family 4 protein [Vibrio parahaemolyticus]MCQ9095002.1 glycosyltransferase family 4 protein [Vibrio parahaemolyticus]
MKIFDVNMARVIKDQQIIRQQVDKKIKCKKYEDAIQYIELFSKLSYHFNNIYTDDFIESCIKNISDVIIDEEKFEPHDVYFFYDSFSIDNRGLTQQYLRALMSTNKDFIYVYPTSNGRNTEILSELKYAKNVSIYELDENLTSINKIKKINEIILKHQPKKAFLHLSPWDIEAQISLSYFSNIKRYLIDLTDHAFWLGKSCSDKFITFRDYGFEISRNYRGIKDSDILYLPYYPVLPLHPVEFQGFGEDLDLKGKVTIFTGGAFYKMYGKNFEFFEILKEIVQRNSNVVILIAGSGNQNPIKKFIEKESLQEKIRLIGNRKDISQVFENIDIYLNTYPIMGALMSQYAILKNKPLIGYSPENIPCNEAESLFFNNNTKFTYSDKIEFYDKVAELVHSVKTNSSFMYDKLLHNESSFNDAFRELIDEHYRNELNRQKKCFDRDAFSELYFEMENQSLKVYELLILQTMKGTLLKDKPIYTLFNLLKYIVRNKLI